LDLVVLLGRLAKLLMRTLAIYVCLVGVWVCCDVAWNPAEATTLQQLSLGEMTQKATAIVRARVTGATEVLRGSDVYTVYQLETLESVKAPNGITPTDVAVPGGVAGGMRQVVAGVPLLEAGREYVLFLWTSRSGLTQLMGMSQGLFRVERTTTGDVIATRAAASEQILDSAGRAVRDETLSMPWAELKSKVTKTLTAGRP
jgi:hypothetical protein